LSAEDVTILVASIDPASAPPITTSLESMQLERKVLSVPFAGDAIQFRIPFDKMESLRAWWNAPQNN